MLKNILVSFFLNEGLKKKENSHSEGKHTLCSSLMGDK